MNKSLLVFLVSFLCVFLSVRSETRIFLLDNSGSMFGKGYEMATYGNVFNNTKEALATHINSLPDSVDVIVVPFCRHLEPEITGSNSEIAQKVLSLDYSIGESDISQAWDEAQALKKPGNNIFFLITDGFDNVGYDDDMETYADYYSSKATDDEITYLYLISDQQKSSNLAQKFIDLPNLDITDSFDVNPFYSAPVPEQTMVTPTLEEETTVDQPEDTSFSLWWLLLLLIALIICIIIYKKKFTHKESWEEVVGNTVPSGNGGINKERRTYYEIVEKPLTPELEDNFKSYCKIENIYAKSRNAILKDFGASKKLVKPAENRHVDFSPVAVVIGKFPSKRGLSKILKSKGLEATVENIRAVHYDIARAAFAKKYRVSKEQAGVIIGKLDHVIHEAEDRKIQIVPNNFHRYKNLYGHNGLVAKRYKELTGVKGYIEED